MERLANLNAIGPAVAVGTTSTSSLWNRWAQVRRQRLHAPHAPELAPKLQQACPGPLGLPFLGTLEIRVTAVMGHDSWHSSPFGGLCCQCVTSIHSRVARFKPGAVDTLEVRVVAQGPKLPSRCDSREIMASDFASGRVISAYRSWARLKSESLLSWAMTPGIVRHLEGCAASVSHRSIRG
jgi:hypothetical protein